MVTMVILLATTHKTQTLGKAAKLAGLTVIQAPISLKQTPPLPHGTEAGSIRYKESTLTNLKSFSVEK